jgi:hypothetical protein
MRRSLLALLTAVSLVSLHSSLARGKGPQAEALRSNIAEAQLQDKDQSQTANDPKNPLHQTLTTRRL